MEIPYGICALRISRLNETTKSLAQSSIMFGVTFLPHLLQINLATLIFIYQHIRPRPQDHHSIPRPLRTQMLQSKKRAVAAFCFNLGWDLIRLRHGCVLIAAPSLVQHPTEMGVKGGRNRCVETKKDKYAAREFIR